MARQTGSYKYDATSIMPAPSIALTILRTVAHTHDWIDNSSVDSLIGAQSSSGDPGGSRIGSSREIGAELLRKMLKILDNGPTRD